ncbi:uncharacterized protein SAPINGB_P001125 [Magnusiomyces paraingens]|uniref:Uncharacterized protein n=1 Tax=Magnusiomyces paraingens TaxID=2606893 RepID=A0A5E8B438_9ASCO|nr:uncharacterized protein SAPINGB_P001125 [Saprochaete ingens]VVT46260.1 unnamed protein product [Saprochaete ingens]
MVSAVRRFIRVGENELVPIRIHLDNELLRDMVRQNFKKKLETDKTDLISEFHPVMLSEREIVNLLEILIPYLQQHSYEDLSGVGPKINIKDKKTIKEFREYGHNPTLSDRIKIESNVTGGWQALVFVPKAYSASTAKLQMYSNDQVLERDIQVMPDFRKEDDDDDDEPEVGNNEEDDVDSKAKKNINVKYRRLNVRAMSGSGTFDDTVDVYVQSKPTLQRTRRSDIGTSSDPNQSTIVL